MWIPVVKKWPYINVFPTTANHFHSTQIDWTPYMELELRFYCPTTNNTAAAASLGASTASWLSAYHPASQTILHLYLRARHQQKQPHHPRRSLWCTSSSIRKRMQFPSIDSSFSLARKWFLNFSGSSLSFFTRANTINSCIALLSGRARLAGFPQRPAGRLYGMVSYSSTIIVYFLITKFAVTNRCPSIKCE